MNCEEFGRYIDNYENLTDAEKTEMTDHAVMCEKCRQELDFFLSILATVKSLPKIDPPADFMDTLNARLDAEDIKAPQHKIIYHVRRNWKQYTSLAACLALVAVITANRGILLDRIEGTEDGVITEQTVGNGDNPVPDSTQTPASDTAEQPEAAPAKTEEAVSENTTQNISPNTVVASASVSRPQPSVRQSRVGETNVQTVNTSAPVQSAATETSAPAQTTAPAEPQKQGDDYGIAHKSTIQSITQEETTSVEYDMTVAEVSASLRASKIIDGYSLADGGETIALGVYYSIDQNGRPIMTNENAIKAVGSLKISSDDAEKAMEILNQYPHDKNENVYTTGSENVEEILSEFSDEDVTYTNYIVGGSDEVKFRIEFN